MGDQSSTSGKELLACCFIALKRATNAFRKGLVLQVHSGLSTTCRKVSFVCLMGFNATFSNISVLYRGGHFYWGMKPKNPEKPPTCRKSLTNVIIMLYTSPWSRFELTTSVVIGTDCIGSCKSNYHALMAMTTPTCRDCLVLKCIITGHQWQLVCCCYTIS